jgi:sugar phosphate isomerase/epimerase
MKAAVTTSLVPEARGGPFVFSNDFPAGCAQAAALGFDGIELFPDSANALPLSVLKAELAKHQLKLAAVGTGAGWVKHRLCLTHADADARARARQFAYATINLAGFCGAPAIIGAMQGRWGDGITREQALNWLAEELRALAERAAAHGQVLLYEPLNRYETNLFNRAADAAAFLEARGLKDVRLLCDLFHMNIEEADVAAALRQVGPRLGHVHFADSNRQAMGFGHTAMAPIAQALCEIGYAGFLSAEVLPLPDPVTAAKQTLATFRQYFGTAQPPDLGPTVPRVE